MRKPDGHRTRSRREQKKKSLNQTVKNRARRKICQELSINIQALLNVNMNCKVKGRK